MRQRGSAMRRVTARVCCIGFGLMVGLCNGAAARGAESWEELTDRAIVLYEDGRYSEATRALEQTLELGRATAETNPTRLAVSLKNLAELYRIQGHYAQAEPLLTQALAILTQVFGERHPTVAACLNNLGLLYANRGNAANAENCFKRALDIDEQMLDAAHPDLASIANNLGNLYMSLGEVKQAEPLYQRALSIERSLGWDTTDGKSVAGTPISRGEAVTAPVSSAKRRKSRRLLSLEHSIGPAPEMLSAIADGLDPTDDETAMRSFSSRERRQPTGLSVQTSAEDASPQALLSDSETTGSPDLARVLNNLAELARRKGRDDEAEALYQRALTMTEHLVGSQHPDTATVLNNLGEFDRRRGHLAEAQRLAEQALMIRQQQLGPDHPDVAASLNNIAAILQAQGKDGEAEAMYRRALALEESRGANEPILPVLLTNLAGLYVLEDRPQEAEPMRQRAVQVASQCYSAQDPRRTQIHYRIASLWNEQGAAGQARTHQRYHRVLAMAAQSMNQRAVAYTQFGQYTVAEDLFKSALTIYERTFGPNHPDIAMILTNYASLLRATNRAKEADALDVRARAIEARPQPQSDQ